MSPVSLHHHSAASHRPVLLVSPYLQKGLSALMVQHNIHHVIMTPEQLEECSEEELDPYEVLFGEPPHVYTRIHKLRNLKWFHSTFVGLESLTVKSGRRDYHLTRHCGYSGPIMAEFVLGQIVSIERHFQRGKMQQERKEWLFIQGRTLDRLTVGVMGATGDIGSNIVKALTFFGARIVGLAGRKRDGFLPLNDISGLRPLPSDTAPLYDPSELPTFLSQVDYVINVLPSTPQTYHLLSNGMLSNCKRSPVFMNVGRGEIIDEASIIEALDKGWIRHAVLDVFEVEPLPQSSPLWERSDVTVFPHSSAEVMPEDVFDVFYQNYQRYCQGKPLQNLVDWERGY